MAKKMAVRGLAVLAGRLFFAWGIVVSVKGLWDIFYGQPDANFYSPAPWQFVTQAEWRRYAGFELCYGLASLLIGRAIFLFSRKLPVYVEK
jgi:hypothetical protein